MQMLCPWVEPAPGLVNRHQWSSAVRKTILPYPGLLDGDRLIPLTQVCRAFGIDARTLRRSGQLTIVRVTPRKSAVRESELKRWLSENIPQQRRETEPTVMPRRPLKERIAETIVGIRDIDAKLAALAEQSDPDEWYIAELMVQRKKLQFALDDLRRAP
jgi:hypothetical protein